MFIVKAMKGGRWSGVFPALCTVTDRETNFDEEGMRRQVRANMEWGADGVCSTIIAGEFFKFSEDERMRITEVVVDEVNGKVPVLAGVSHSGTELAIKLAIHAEEIGADGVIAMVPYFNHSPSRAIVKNHIGSICCNTDLPVMLQDAEDATGIHLCPTQYLELAEEHDNLKSIKLEGPRTLEKLKDINKIMPGRVSVFGGMAAKLVIDEARYGSDGTIPSGCLTDLIKQIWIETSRRDYESASMLYRRYKPWVNFFQDNPGATAEIEKETLKLRGVISESSSRGPNITLGTEGLLTLRNILKEMNVI
jgi:4-hydroxy-tetrahydrodipicolinate synthase